MSQVIYLCWTYQFDFPLAYSSRVKVMGSKVYNRINLGCLTTSKTVVQPRKQRMIKPRGILRLTDQNSNFINGKTLAHKAKDLFNVIHQPSDRVGTSNQVFSVSVWRWIPTEDIQDQICLTDGINPFFQESTYQTGAPVGKEVNRYSKSSP